MVMPSLILRAGIRKPNSAGLVTTTGTVGVPVADLVHTLGINRSGARRSAIIRKITAYNNTGGNVPLQFGTQDSAAVPAFVQLLPDLVALNTLDNVWGEDEIPVVEFAINRSLLAVGREGNIYVSSLGAAAGVVVVIEVEEFGS